MAFCLLVGWWTRDKLVVCFGLKSMNQSQFRDMLRQRNGKTPQPANAIIEFSIADILIGKQVIANR